MFERVEIVDEQGREWIYVYESEVAANTGQMWVRRYIRNYQLSKTQFRSRFTTEELVTIEIMRLTSSDIVVKATLNVLMDSLSSANEVDVNYPETIAGIQKLVEFGLLTQQRATEILLPPENTQIG